jgi:hypothetical protein
MEPESVDQSVDLSSWLGKPPENSKPLEQQPEDAESQGSDSGDRRTPISISDASSSADDILHEEPIHNRVKRARFSEEPSSGDEDASLAAVTSRLQHNFYIDVPKLSEEEKQEYEYLPGHFSVRRVLSNLEGDQHIVELESGERDLVSLYLMSRSAVTLDFYRLFNSGHPSHALTFRLTVL